MLKSFSILPRGKPKIKVKGITVFIFAILIISLLLSVRSPVYADAAAEQFLNANYYSYDVYAYNVPSTVNSVIFPTWNCAHNQGDTIKDVNGIKVDSTTWKVHIDIKDFKYYTGSYQTDVYYTDNSGQHYYSSGFHNIPARYATVENGTTYGYDVIAHNMHPDTTKIVFPTWTDYNGQDDLKWAIGNNIGGGLWVYHVNKSDHNNEYGKYETHVYCTITNNYDEDAFISPGYDMPQNTVSMTAAPNNSKNNTLLN